MIGHTIIQGNEITCGIITLEVRTPSTCVVRSVNFEMSFWCLQFPPKIEWKQVDLRFHSSKAEFVHLFFGGNIGLKNCFNFIWPLVRSARHKRCWMSLTNEHLKSLVKARAAMFVQQVSLTSSTMFLPHTCLFAIYELNYPEAITALGCNKNKEFPLYYYVLYTL